MTDDVDAWLAEGDAPEADWGSHLLALALADGLGAADGDGDAELLLDLPALAAPFACRPHTCTPGRRPARARSCCADVLVQPTPGERAAITRALPHVRAWMTEHDHRWANGPPTLWTDEGLARPRGRCVFASEEADGLRCGLHVVEDAQGWRRGTIKPMPCRLFPLVVVDLGDGRRLLTAVTPRTARKVGLASAKVFPCLGDPVLRPALYQSQRDTIEALWGPAVYRAIGRGVGAWRRRQTA
ncbi:MAG: hypothetical protein H6733_07150 [Alphaproteobacteria bacterium]|nr:hypothetical protein [Alphaproteobacteria bacterium]